MIRRLLFCALVAFSLSSARADVQSDILTQITAIKNAFESMRGIWTSTSFTVDDISDNTAAIIDLLGYLKDFTSEVQNGIDASIMLADIVSSNFPQVQEDVAGILANILNFATDMETLLETLEDVSGATASCASQLVQLQGDVSQLNLETTQQYIADQLKYIATFLSDFNSQFSSIAQNTYEIMLNSEAELDYFYDWDSWFYSQFEDALVPYTSLHWYSLDDAPWLHSNRYRPHENTLSVGSNLPRNFFKDIADVLVADSRINADIANSILFICSQLANTNQFANNQQEFESQLSDTVSSANDDKSTLDQMTFGFNLDTPSQFQQIDRVRQLSKYSVNSLPGEDLVVSGFEGFDDRISNIRGNLHLSNYASFFHTIRGFFAFLYWGIFILFIWKLFRLIIRLFAFFKFQSVNFGPGLFHHNDYGFIV